jgi:LEA14-like dessication related protein
MQKLKLKLSAVLLVAFMATGTSCAFLRESLGLGSYRPRVSLKGIEVDKIAIEYIKLDVLLYVENPNSFELNFSDVDYTLNAGESLLASGNFKEKVIIPANEQRVIHVPVRIESQSALKMVRMFFIRHQPIFLRWHARALFQTPLRTSMEVGFYGEKHIK